MHDTFEKEDYMATGRPEDQGELFPGQVTSVEVSPRRCVLRTSNRCAVELTAPEPSVFRVRYAPSGRFTDGFSYAIANSNTGGQAAEPCPLEVEEGPGSVRVSTGAMSASVRRDGLAVRFEDQDGDVLAEDEKGFHWRENPTYGGEIVINTRSVQPGEHFYGLGDKSSRPDLRSKRFSLWGSDTYAYDEHTDPLYKNFPFYIGLHHGRAYGTFFDNSFRSFFDFGEERRKVMSFWAHGGEMDYYVIAGPRIGDVVQRFAALTGKPELPPLWALGYHQCKWSYKSQAEVAKIARRFRQEKIPCDAVYVDIDYMDGFRCFTWNREHFPDPAKMTGDLEAIGMKTVAIIDPGIKIDPGYEVYEEGVGGDHFCQRMDGALLSGHVWPGACHFPDFTAGRTRAWWATLFQGLVGRDGIAGVWTDMNEPAVFNEEKTFPRDVRHDYDGHPCSHRKAHNVYGMQMARATRDGILAANNGKRAFVLTRSAFAGTQRYAAAWTGDNISNWHHLKLANIQCQRLAVSGYSFVGSDIGGFLEEADGELFTRWIQMGVFHPFCRTHSSGEHADQEPWSFGEPFTSIARAFINLRYRLLGYLYTAFWQNATAGTPVLRPLVYLDDTDHETYRRAEEFGVGDHLLVCPISEPGADGRWLYLPRGGWYDFWTDRPQPGGDEVFADAPLDKIPLFVRAGAVLPLGPVRQYSGEPVDAPTELHVYRPADAHPVASTLYGDEGDGFGYRDGAFSLRRFETTAGDTSLTVTQKLEGGPGQNPRPFRVVLHGVTAAKAEAHADGKPAKLTRDGNTWTAAEVPDGFGELAVTW